MNTERLLAPLRSTEEMFFYLGVHPCPQCGSREYGELRGRARGLYEWEVEGRPGVVEQRSSVNYVLTCPQCGHERSYLCWQDPTYNQHDNPFGQKDFNLGGPEPSLLISPHEFVAELLRVDGELPPHVIEIRPSELADRERIVRALQCCTELLKFFREGIDEIPLEHFRTAEARVARDAHRERFTRAFVLAHLATYTKLHEVIWGQMEADYAADKAAGIVRTPIQVPLVGFSAAALEVHARWLANKGGKRLEVRDVDATARKLSTLDLSGAVIEHVKLERVDLSFARLHAAKLADVNLRGADLSSAMIAGTTITNCTFADAAMVIAKLGDAEISNCDFSNANLDRSSWYRSKVTNCKFVGSRMTDTGIDKAVFKDCDFRCVDFSHGRYETGTGMDAQFIDCDLRDTKWLDRDLFRVSFINCKLAGVSGRPNTTDAVFERPDVSPAGDGSQIGTWRDALGLWGIDPDHPRDGLTWIKQHMFTLGEYEVLKPHLNGLGATIENEAISEGNVYLALREPIDHPIAAKLQALLVPYRESIKPPPTEREIRHARLAQDMIDDATDRGLSFEETVAQLMQHGFTRDEAMTAMTRPVR